MIRRILFSTSMLVCAFAASGAMAAEAAAAGATTVGEVLVTAQKRAENVQDVPISMEVVSAQKLEAFHSDTFRALSVPNMNTQNIGGNDVIYIRGFGSPSQNYSFDQAVSLYVDGIYAGRNRQFMAPFFDLERIEVCADRRRPVRQNTRPAPSASSPPSRPRPSRVRPRGSTISTRRGPSSLATSQVRSRSS